MQKISPLVDQLEIMLVGGERSSKFPVGTVQALD